MLVNLETSMSCSADYISYDGRTNVFLIPDDLLRTNMPDINMPHVRTLNLCSHCLKAGGKLCNCLSQLNATEVMLHVFQDWVIEGKMAPPSSPSCDMLLESIG